VEDLRIGQLFRAVRRRLGWRQVDVARRAGVSQQLIASVEAGRLDELTVHTLRAIGAALQIQLPFDPRWRGGVGDALLDARHAAIVGAVVTILRLLGWSCILEYTFSQYGERGSVDIVAWHPVFRALLIIEVKSRLFDVQALFSGIDRKARLVPELLANERGWQARATGRVVVVEESRANRSAVHRNAAAFEVALPSSSREVRRWLRHPGGSLAGLWFLTPTPGAGDKRRNGGPQRVRMPGSRSARAPRTAPEAPASA
jgi:transcriptional regulator with XRE-family HTH domain